MGDGLKRARDATRQPSKPWRVRGPNLPEDFRSQKAAYEAVQELNGWGHVATVYHFEDGRWVLYERVEPSGESGQVPEPVRAEDGTTS
jgi:hypothetical protein